MNAASGEIIPIYWDFDDLVTSPEGNKKDLNIKCPTIQSLNSEEIIGDFPSEAFKTTLCVHETWNRQDSDDIVEYPTNKVTILGLIVADSTWSLS